MKEVLHKFVMPRRVIILKIGFLDAFAPLSLFSIPQLRVLLIGVHGARYFSDRVGLKDSVQCSIGLNTSIIGLLFGQIHYAEHSH